MKTNNYNICFHAKNDIKGYNDKIDTYRAEHYLN